MRNFCFTNLNVVRELRTWGVIASRISLKGSCRPCKRRFPLWCEINISRPSQQTCLWQVAFPWNKKAMSLYNTNCNSMKLQDLSLTSRLLRRLIQQYLIVNLKIIVYLNNVNACHWQATFRWNEKVFSLTI